MKTGDDHRLVDSVHGECVELAVEQCAAVEVDQALGPVVDQMAEARALAGGKDDGFHIAVAVPSKCGADWALAMQPLMRVAA